MEEMMEVIELKEKFLNNYVSKSDKAKARNDLAILSGKLVTASQKMGKEIFGDIAK